LRIHVNGELRELEEDLSVPELIMLLHLKPEQIAIELNQSVIRRAEWPGTILRDGDKVEIVHFVGGGCSSRQ
jgi:thiamine biosynthesis protein ThiS